MTLSPQNILEIKNNFRAIIESFVFLKTGPDKFTSDIFAFIRSCAIPLVLVSIQTSLLPNSTGHENQTYFWEVTYQLIYVVLSTTIFLSAMFAFKSHDTTNAQFFKYATAYNWLSLPAFLVFLPLILMGNIGLHDWDTLYAMMVLGLLYAYGVNGYLIAKLFNLRWYVATSYAIMDFLIGRIVNNLADFFMNAPLPPAAS
jgi:hypothetical protein